MSITSEHNAARFAELLQRSEPGSTLVRAWALTGGVSAQVTALEIARTDGTTHTLVARQHGAADRAANPHVAETEFALLQHLHAAGVAVPTPVYLEKAGPLFPVPTLVQTYIEGTPATALAGEQIDQFAQQLAKLHALDYAALRVPHLPTLAADTLLRDQPPTHTESAEAQEIRRALATIMPTEPRNQPVLLHGDYWPGNTLWRKERLVAVIDWENAAVGDPLADLANSRLEVLLSGDADAMERFTQHYLALAPCDLAELAAWELRTALRPARNMAAWGLDEQTERTMRDGLRAFIRGAIAKLEAA